jgi:hypothetical protein
MNKSLLHAVVSMLEDTQSIRNGISSINGEDSSASVRLLLRSVFTHCDAIDCILQEALARSCDVSNNVLSLEEDEADDRDIILSGIVR